MGCCLGTSKRSTKNEVEMQDVVHFKKYPKGTIRKKRKCRDVLFLLLFMAFWVGMILIAVFAFSNGNPERFVFILKIS